MVHNFRDLFGVESRWSNLSAVRRRWQVSKGTPSTALLLSPAENTGLRLFIALSPATTYALGTEGTQSPFEEVPMEESRLDVYLDDAQSDNDALATVAPEAATGDVSQPGAPVLAPAGSEAMPATLQLESKVIQMSYHGGLIGMFSDNRKKLQDEIQRWNDDGFRLRHVLPGKPGIFTVIVQAVCLFFTMMLWAPVPGEALVFERGR